jgi:NmrA-like family
MNPTRILVLGAGELGTSVIRHLARRAAEHPGASLTVLLRGSTINSDDPAKRREVYALRALGVDLLAGDVTATADELAEVFHEFDTVICCTGFVGGKGTQLRIAHAVLAAGVKRYFPWQFGVDYEVIGRGSAQAGWDEQLDVRDLLRTQSDTAWVIVSTGMFTSFLFEPSFGVVDLDNDVVHALGSWDNTVTVTAPDDIGALTAEICLFHPTIANSVVYTAGDTISYARLADTVEAVLGRKMQRVEWTLPWLERELAAAPDDLILQYRMAFASGTGVSWDMDCTFNVRQSIGVVDVEQWMRANLT